MGKWCGLDSKQTTIMTIIQDGREEGKKEDKSTLLFMWRRAKERGTCDLDFGKRKKNKETWRK